MAFAPEGQHPAKQIVTLINNALTALSCGTDTADAASYYGFLDRPKCDGNGPIATCSFTEGHGEIVIGTWIDCCACTTKGIFEQRSRVR